MKITPKVLKFLSGVVILAGAVVSVLTEGKWKYVAIGIMVAGMVLLMPWVKEKKE